MKQRGGGSHETRGVGTPDLFVGALIEKNELIKRRPAPAFNACSALLLAPALLKLQKYVTG